MDIIPKPKLKEDKRYHLSPFKLLQNLMTFWERPPLSYGNIVQGQHHMIWH